MSVRFDLSERLSWPFFGPEHRARGFEMTIQVLQTGGLAAPQRLFEWHGGGRSSGVRRGAGGLGRAAAVSLPSSKLIRAGIRAQGHMTPLVTAGGGWSHRTAESVYSRWQ